MEGDDKSWAELKIPKESLDHWSMSSSTNCIATYPKYIATKLLVDWVSGFGVEIENVNYH